MQSKIMKTTQISNKTKMPLMGGRPGMYSVFISREWGENDYRGDGLSKSAASAMAKLLMAEGESDIYVAFFRSADGQHGYLNQDGNHSIIGKDWSE